MDKNTIWAIVLSTVVIVASYLLLPRFFPGMRPENMVSQQTENAETNDVEELSLENDESTLVAEENKVMETAADEAVIDEETIFGGWQSLKGSRVGWFCKSSTLV